MHHQYSLLFARDGDYVIWESLVNGEWVEHTRWMIPGSQLDD